MNNYKIDEKYKKQVQSGAKLIAKSVKEAAAALKSKKNQSTNDLMNGGGAVE